MKMPRSFHRKKSLQVELWLLVHARLAVSWRFSQLWILDAVINTGVSKEGELSTALPCPAACCPSSSVSETVDGAAP